MKKRLNDLMGCTIEHKFFGSCKIVEINDVECGKITVEVLKDNVLKKVIFSSQYFNDLDDYNTIQVTVKKPKNPLRKYKEVDYRKHRNHPLVKEIERREMGYRRPVVNQGENEEDDQAE